MLGKKTKIIATLGPASGTDEIVEQLILNGMNVARLNFSHGDHESHKERIDQVRKVSTRLGRHVGIMLDTKGPEVRLHDMENKGVQFNKNDTFIITTKKVLGNHERFSLSYKGLINCIAKNDIIKIDDGEFVCRVTGVNLEKKEIYCIAINSHFVKSRKGVNLPDIKLSLPYISKADEEDIRFGCDQDVDFIAASFVRTKKDILAIKTLTAKFGKPNLPIIAKIENKEGIDHLDDILSACEGIMVARGDMGVEVDVCEVPFIQEAIIEKCRLVGKPVIVATQMLNSMQTNLVPTRAEVSDVSLAITQGCDCVMLSGESASGKYPVESVAMQTRIAIETERHLDYPKLAINALASSNKTMNDALMNSIATTAILTGAKVIISLNWDGNGTTRLAKARTICPILMITDSVHVARRLSIVWGVVPRVEKVISLKKLSHNDVDKLARLFASKYNCVPGDKVVVCGSVDGEDDELDLMRIIEIQ